MYTAGSQMGSCSMVASDFILTDQLTDLEIQLQLTLQAGTPARGMQASATPCSALGTSSGAPGGRRRRPTALPLTSLA